MSSFWFVVVVGLMCGFVIVVLSDFCCYNTVESWSSV